MDEKTDESNVISDFRVPGGGKGTADAANKLLKQLRRTFKIEAVGLMSLWFSFGSGVLARFVVEWESGKEGCTMHVSPDQLWPHTKVCQASNAWLYLSEYFFSYNANVSYTAAKHHVYCRRLL